MMHSLLSDSQGQVVCESPSGGEPQEFQLTLSDVIWCLQLVARVFQL